MKPLDVEKVYDGTPLEAGEVITVFDSDYALIAEHVIVAEISGARILRKNMIFP